MVGCFLRSLLAAKRLGTYSKFSRPWTPSFWSAWVELLRYLRRVVNERLQKEQGLQLELAIDII